MYIRVGLMLSLGWVSREVYSGTCRRDAGVDTALMLGGSVQLPTNKNETKKRINSQPNFFLVFSFFCFVARVFVRKTHTHKHKNKYHNMYTIHTDSRLKLRKGDETFENVEFSKTKREINKIHTHTNTRASWLLQVQHSE